MAEPLFEDFPDLSTTDWLAQVQKDLKGQPMSRLEWEHESGIALGAIYGPPPGDFTAGFPGLGDYRRGATPLAQRAQGWEMCQDIRLTTPAALMKRMEAVQDWPDAIRLVLPRAQEWAYAGQPADQLLDASYPWDKASDFQPALDLLAARGVKVRLQAGQQFLTRGALLIASADPRLALELEIGPLDALGSHPLPDAFLDRMLADGQALSHHLRASHPGAKPLTINMEPLAMQGANLAQQLAYALSIAVEYASAFVQQGIAPQEVFGCLSFHFPVGTDFFGEIARLRAFRMVWAGVLAAYGIEGDIAPYTRILTTGSRRQLTALDTQTNILRATTSAMSAILGGSDSISLPTFDENAGTTSGLSLRLATNVQRVLREESLLDRVIDPVGGAYYLEHLTEALANRAWEIFQTTEADGGYRAALQAGKIAAAVSASAAKRSTAIRKGKVTVLGINQYPPSQEHLADLHLQPVRFSKPVPTTPEALAALSTETQQRVDAIISYIRKHPSVDALDAALLELLGGRAHVGPIGDHEGADFERLRIRVGAHIASGASAPRAVLLTFGDLAMRKARASFAANLLGSAAVLTVETEHPEDLDAAMAAMKAQAPGAIVLCAADPDYADEVPVLLPRLISHFPDSRIYLAGRPAGWEDWQSQGLTDAIFAGMDRWAFLNQFLNDSIGKEAHHAS